MSDEEGIALRILVSAFACDPLKGSEAGQGWNWSLQASRHHEVWVLTNEIHREAIEAWKVDHPHANLKFYFVGVPFWRYPTGPAIHKVYYYVWQLVAASRVRTLHRQLKFDVMHHLSYNAIDAPGFLWLLGAPFVWGPVGGGQIPPTVLRRYFGRGWLNECLRATRKRLLRFDPVVRLAVVRASHILAANRDTEQILRSMGARNISRCIDAGVQCQPQAPGSGPAEDTWFTIIWSGNFLPRKAPMLALDAFSALVQQGHNARMIMVGDGILRRHVEKEARARRLNSRIEFPGWISHAEMQTVYGQGNAFLFTSLQDTSGNVVLEAMAQCLPIVALNHHGAAEMVSAESGILVGINNVDQVIADLASALGKLAQDRSLRQSMGANGRERVERMYDWDCKGSVLDEVYGRVAGIST